MFTSAASLNCFTWYPGSPLKLLLSTDVLQLINAVYRGDNIEPDIDITLNHLRFNLREKIHTVTASATTFMNTYNFEEIGFNLTADTSTSTATATAIAATATATTSYRVRASLNKITLVEGLLTDAMNEGVNDQPVGENATSIFCTEDLTFSLMVGEIDTTADSVNDQQTGRNLSERSSPSSNSSLNEEDDDFIMIGGEFSSLDLSSQSNHQPETK